MVHKAYIWFNISFILFFLVIGTSQHSNRKKITYFATEHPNVTYFNPEYLKYFKLTAQRYSRWNPFYYVGLHFHLLVPVGHSYKVHFYFYELLTNVYKRGFIEMHMSLCDLILKDKFFGTALRSSSLKICPITPGEYHLYNMTIPVEEVPKGFPFIKGRIYCNITYQDNEVVLVASYIDLELKQFTQP